MILSTKHDSNLVNKRAGGSYMCAVTQKDKISLVLQMRVNV